MDFEGLANILKFLGNPKRLQILDVLEKINEKVEQGEAKKWVTAKEVAVPLNLGSGPVSIELKKLYDKLGIRFVDRKAAIVKEGGAVMMYRITEYGLEIYRYLKNMPVPSVG